MHGFLNIDKPSGMTSFDVIRRLKLCLPRNTRIGHLGTLDPMATGVLPIAVGQATRIIHYIEDSHKEYLASMVLGAVSDTQDAWGQITCRQPVKVRREQLESVIQSFLGAIWQEPPMYSAVHHQGVRLYELARQGKTVARKKRPVEIKSLELIRYDDQPTLPAVDLRVVCSRGTYIRTLCHDIGDKLGTGAFLTALTRTGSGGFLLTESLNLEKVLDLSIKDLLLPIDHPLQHWPRVVVRAPEEVRAVRNGQTIIITDGLAGDLVRIYDLEDRLLAIAKAINIDDKCGLKPERVFHIQ